MKAADDLRDDGMFLDEMSIRIIQSVTKAAARRNNCLDLCPESKLDHKNQSFQLICGGIAYDRSNLNFAYARFVTNHLTLVTNGKYLIKSS
jgi:hypothetical protein